MSLYINKCFNAENNYSKLVIFIHGYNACISDIEPYAELLINKNSKLLVVTPEAPFVCEKNQNKRQWYSLWEHDPKDERRNPETPLSILSDIYDRYGNSISNTAKNINQFIDEMQKQYNIDDDNTYIIGFSQGAMIALYTSLSRKNKIAACFAIAGVIAGKSLLKQELKSKPNVFLFHGRDDITVSYKTLDNTIAWLSDNNINVQDFRYDNLAHKITDDEIIKIAELIS